MPKVTLKEKREEKNIQKILISSENLKLINWDDQTTSFPKNYADFYNKFYFSANINISDIRIIQHVHNVLIILEENHIVLILHVIQRGRNLLEPLFTN